MKSTKLQRDILRWEYENETKDMYSPPSPIEWLENKLIELRKHDVVGRSEQLPPNSITYKEHKDLMKALYPKDNSKRFRR